MITNAKIVGIGVNAESYHAQKSKRGDLDFVMSSSSLRIFGQCAKRWLEGYEPPASEAKEYGSLLDCRLLVPEQFKIRYAIKPESYPDSKTGDSKPWNMNANFCKDWARNQGNREIVSIDQVNEVDAAINQLRKDEIVSSFIDASDTQVHIKAEWRDERTGLVVPIQALLDLLPKPDSEFAQTAGDLKSTRNAGLEPWTRFCFQLGFHVQAAFFLDMASAAEGSDRNTFCFILQENYPPWMVGRRMLSQDFIQIGRQTYQDLLTRYCQCLKTGRFPSYDDHSETVQGWSVVSPMPFMEYQALSEALERDQKDALQTARDQSESVDVVP